MCNRTGTALASGATLEGKSGCCGIDLNEGSDRTMLGIDPGKRALG